MSEPKFAIDAEERVVAAVEALKDVQQAWGRGAGGRELSLAVTNAEQALLWLNQGRRIAAEASTPA